MSNVALAERAAAPPLFAERELDEWQRRSDAEEARAFAAIGAPEYSPAPAGAVLIEDLPEEAGIQAEYHRGLGALPVGQVVRAPEGVQKPKKQSLLSDMEQAVHGRPEALEEQALLVLFEGILNEGVSEVRVTRNEHGELVQHGHRFRDVLEQAIRFNAGEHSALHDITRAAGIDLYAWDALDKAGYFDKGDVWVVPRLAPVGVPATPLRKYGYFENVAVSWSIIWKDAPNSFKLRSLFTAGAEVHDHEESLGGKMTPLQLDSMMESRLQRRYDIRGVSGVYERLGLRLPSKLLGFHRGFKIRRAQLKHPDNPEAALAEMYDEALGPGFFYGKRGPKGDYVAYSKGSLALLDQLRPLARAVAAEQAAYHGVVTGEMEATRLLARIGRQRIIDYVIDHPEVDARPLGLAAVVARQEYYQRMAVGDIAGAGSIRKNIHRVSRVNMCGMEVEEDDEGDEDDPKSKAAKKKREAQGLCEIETKGCPCCIYYQDGTKRRIRITVKAVDDGNKVSCLRGNCTAYASKKGGRGRQSLIVRKAESREKQERMRKILGLGATGTKQAISPEA